MPIARRPEPDKQTINRALSFLVASRATGAACILLAATIIAAGFRSAGSAMLAEASFRQGYNLNTAIDFRPPATVKFTAGHLSHGYGD